MANGSAADYKSIERNVQCRHSTHLSTGTNALSSRSPINRPWDSLKAWRKSPVPILACVVERDDQAVGDDRLIEGVLPICRSCDRLELFRNHTHGIDNLLPVLRLDAIPTVALMPKSVMLR
jgi:hypothetical protein